MVWGSGSGLGAITWVRTRRNHADGAVERILRFVPPRAIWDYQRDCGNQTGGRAGKWSSSSEKPSAFEAKWNVPASLISQAASISAAKPSLDSAEPTLIRLTPASASSATLNVAPGSPMRTLTGLLNESQTFRILSSSCSAGA